MSIISNRDSSKAGMLKLQKNILDVNTQKGNLTICVVTSTEQYTKQESPFISCCEEVLT